MAWSCTLFFQANFFFFLTSRSSNRSRSSNKHHANSHLLFGVLFFGFVHVVVGFLFVLSLGGSHFLLRRATWVSGWPKGSLLLLRFLNCFCQEKCLRTNAPLHKTSSIRVWHWLLRASQHRMQIQLLAAGGVLNRSGDLSWSDITAKVVDRRARPTQNGFTAKPRTGCSTHD